MTTEITIMVTIEMPQVPVRQLRHVDVSGLVTHDGIKSTLAAAAAAAMQDLCSAQQAKAAIGWVLGREPEHD